MPLQRHNGTFQESSQESSNVINPASEDVAWRATSSLVCKIKYCRVNRDDLEYGDALHIQNHPPRVVLKVNFSPMNRRKINFQLVLKHALVWSKYY
jgi:hypothetical protein